MKHIHSTNRRMHEKRLSNYENFLPYGEIACVQTYDEKFNRYMKELDGTERKVKLTISTNSEYS